ncbi:SprT family zinc-dependent metalloprotease [Thiocapsa sp.]|uniref:M48 family metallopeptidase n=1 Tax=Thiocapsa sp. TaxID=2024551 RepID=UPI002BD723AF|nr:SprT family zinc-dependent metalloprotease [Thiocapsa sp.]HSO82903.1 SprT family zinc-dependent metalloprotease [Thiocapsa sp.]
MPPAERLVSGRVQRLDLGGREVACRLVHSKNAKKLRIRVRGPTELELVIPEGRDEAEGLAFLAENLAWIKVEVERAKSRLALRQTETGAGGTVLLRGETVPVRVSRIPSWRGPNRVALRDGAIQITTGPRARTSVVQSLENWLRRLARERIAHHISLIGPRLQRAPGKVFVMDQRTKWGNCSALGNLSFNWRLVMAPDDVLRYIVTHELVHLAIPDHSTRFWLTVRSHCPGSERARQWLAANGHRLTVDLADRLAGENATDTP